MEDGGERWRQRKGNESMKNRNKENQSVLATYSMHKRKSKYWNE